MISSKVNITGLNIYKVRRSLFKNDKLFLIQFDRSIDLFVHQDDIRSCAQKTTLPESIPTKSVFLVSINWTIAHSLANLLYRAGKVYCVPLFPPQINSGPLSACITSSYKETHTTKQGITPTKPCVTGLQAYNRKPPTSAPITKMSDPTHTERRLEGIRQCNIQIAAAKSGSSIPTLDTSFISEDAFLSKNGGETELCPLERFLKLDAHQEATVVYTRTATQNELAALGVWKSRKA